MKLGMPTPVQSHFTFMSSLPLTYGMDIKPGNILVNYGSESCRFTDVQLADFGETCRIDPEKYLKV